jgi:hypothetical protein
MAVADDYDTPDIFGFDKQFRDAGYHRLNRSTRHWDTAISAKARVPACFTGGSVRILCGPI